jgi:two-component system chemotaxis sensor kinase CheA
MFELDADIMRQLRATFKVEAEEHIQGMNRVLLELERGPDEEERVPLLEEIFRAAHSLKGASGAADLAEVESTAHRLESVFYSAKIGEVVLTPDLCDVLYDAVDAMSIIVDASLEEEPHGLDLPELHARLDAANEGRVLPSSRTPPAPAEAEVDSAKAAVVAEAEPAAETSRPSKRKAKPVVVEETIRVATSKLDFLMTQAGELLVAGLKIDQRLHEVEQVGHTVEDWNREWLKVRATHNQLLRNEAHKEIQPLLSFLELNQQRLRDLAAKVGDLWRIFSGDTLHLSRVTDELGESVMKVRMLPASTVFDTFPRLVRDVARDRGKEVELQIIGGETELDRKVLEEIKDPLIHVLRNSVDHGVETPEERERVGKPRKGTVTLSAIQKGNHIVIAVADDGAGIDVERVKRKAVESGLIGPDQAETMSDDEGRRLIFASGLSTAAMITDISGRGVGMDVVRKNVESLHGDIDLDSTLGQGTTMTITLPLTLATTQELLVAVGGQTLGIPISSVERIMRVQKRDIKNVEGKEAILVGSEPVSVVHLADILELTRKDAIRADQKFPVVILGTGRKRIAFLVDAVVGQQESVVKNLGKQLSRVRNVTGATILGTGQVIMTLNPVDLLKSAQMTPGTSVLVTRVAQAQARETLRPKVLVVDDSVTTRNLEKTILETAGYDVRVAADGLDALNVLRSDGCDVIVSDVLMPNMDGFELTANVKDDPLLKDIPVILVTSLEKRRDKEKGIEVGADAFIVKSDFDQTSLLRTIEQLV